MSYTHWNPPDSRIPSDPSRSAPTAQPAQPARVGQANLQVQTRAWLVQRRNAGATPDQLSDELIAAGFDADSAARTALGSLRVRDQHRLVYWTLTFSAGFGALALASALHLMLAGNPSPLTLAWWLTLALIAAPLCGVSYHWARAVERTEPHAIWSPTRRALFAVLAGITATVGLARLFAYLFDFVAAITGVQGYRLNSESLGQVIVSLAVAVPLFAWSLTEWRRSNVVYRTLTADSSSSPGAGVGQIDR